MNVADPATPDQMRARYQQLLKLRDEVDAELDALSEGLRVAGVDWRGRPRKRAVMSSEDAKRAHTAYVSGDKSTWAREGERQYQRESKRRNYQRRTNENLRGVSHG